MSIRFATDDEIANWDAKILDNPDGGNVFQGTEFAEQKKLTKWKPRYIVANHLAITVHEKRVTGHGKFWYIPKGPGVGTLVQLGNLIPELKAFAYQSGVFAIKIESELEKSDDAAKAMRAFDTYHVSPIQPNASTVLIDLSPHLDNVMASLNQKGRHAIRRAERDGVMVEQVPANEENCRLFYDLLADTAAGHKFFIRSYDYHRDFWQRYASSGHGQLFFAYFNGQIVAGAFAMIFGTKSTYKDGASIRERTVYGASHLLQWRVIEWAKAHGSKQHDLCGSPPSDRINDESHPHYGVGRFKTSFNKQVTDYIGAYDIAVRPRQYGWWKKFGERATKKLWWRKHHDSWY